MTLPASGTISMSQVASELGLANAGINLNHVWVRALAQKASGAISLGDLHGKTGRFDGNLAGIGGGGSPQIVNFSGGTKIFGMGLVSALVDSSGNFNLNTDGAGNWTGNLKFVNNTTGFSIVSSRFNVTNWTAAGASQSLIRTGFTDSFTILPSN